MVEEIKVPAFDLPFHALHQTQGHMHENAESQALHCNNHKRPRNTRKSIVKQNGAFIMEQEENKQEEQCLEFCL